MPGWTRQGQAITVNGCYFPPHMPHRSVTLGIPLTDNVAPTRKWLDAPIILLCVLVHVMIMIISVVINVHASCTCCITSYAEYNIWLLQVMKSDQVKYCACALEKC